MQREFWPILLVDDEPDVLRMSELAMSDFTVYDLPIKLYTAASKAEAIELLSTKLTRGMPGTFSLAVAFVDVVMESDTAGLELCQHIREAAGNQTTQLFIRTGQPGIAPEREVMDRYDINGYFTKVEATEDKLYSLVKSGVRQFLTLQTSLGMCSFMDHIVKASGSRETMKQFVQNTWKLLGQDAASNAVEGFRFNEFIFLGGTNGDAQTLGVGIDEATALAIRERLNQLPGVPLGASGDKYVIDDNHNILLKVAGGPAQMSLSYVTQATTAYPDVHLRLSHSFWSIFATLWHRAS